MINKKAKRLIVTNLISVVLTTTLMSYPLYSVIKENNEALRQNQELGIVIKNSRRAIDDLTQRSDYLQKTIQDHQKEYETVDGIIKENKKLKEENDVLTLYQNLQKSQASRGTSISNKRVEVQKIKVEISMYYRGECNGHKTASCTYPNVGIIAAPVDVPFGTEIVIPGFKCPDVPNQVFVVADRGGYIQKVGDTYRIDVFVENKSTAIKFGRQTMYGYFVAKS